MGIRAGASSVRRRARWALAAILVLLVATSLYGVAAPCIWGHYGHHNGEYVTRARHTLRHGAILPYNEPGWDAPGASTLYLHHPILTHHLASLTLTVLGDHEFSVRAAGILGFVAAFAALVALLWQAWGPRSAVLGGLFTILVPINVWFGSLLDPGLPSIACLLGWFVAYERWLAREDVGTGVVAASFMALACGFEWSPYLAALPIGLHVLWTAVHRRGRHVAFAVAFALAVLLPLAFHVLVAWKTGRIADGVASYGERSSRPVGFAQHMWLSAGAMYSYPLVGALAIWTAWRGAEVARGRGRFRDLVGATFLYSQVVYAFLFPEGIALHSYRLLYGFVACVIAVVDLDEALAAVARRPGVLRDGIRVGRVGALSALVGNTAIDAAGALRDSRAVGGAPLRTSYDPETDKIAFAELVRDSTRPGDLLVEHRSFAHRAELWFYLDRNSRTVNSLDEADALPATERARAVVLCASGALAPADEAVLERWGRHHPVRFVDRYVFVDLRAPVPSLEAFRTRVPSRGVWRRYLEGPHPRLERERIALPVP